VGAYALAWLSYRAAVHAAEEYGQALVVLFDLNHRALDEHSLTAAGVEAGSLRHLKAVHPCLAHGTTTTPENPQDARAVARS
jgi:hypothetical protein